MVRVIDEKATSRYAAMVASLANRLLDAAPVPGVGPRSAKDSLLHVTNAIGIVGVVPLPRVKDGSVLRGEKVSLKTLVRFIVQEGLAKRSAREDRVVWLDGEIIALLRVDSSIALSSPPTECELELRLVWVGEWSEPFNP